MIFYFLVDKYLNIGKTTIEYEDEKLTIFNRDRTICDIIRYEKKIDKEIFNKAIKAYIEDKQKNISHLIDYSKKLNIEKKVKNVIGMWL